jgi:hypothetical protein
MAAPTSGSSNITSLADGFKELFPQTRLEQLSLINRDFLRWIDKKDKLEGDGLNIPYRYASPQGIGSVFTTAQSNITAGKVKRVTLYRKSYYGLVTIDNESARAARSDIGAFYNIKEAEMEDIVQRVAQELEVHLWRDGNGNVGVIASITSAVGSVITLENAEDVANFHIGQTIGCNDELDGNISTGTDRGGEEKVDSVDVDAGTITMTTNVNSDHGWVATDFLFNGTGDAATGDGGSVVNGLGAWIPAVAETSGTFLGMDRTGVPHLLQGFRQGFLGSVEETIKKLHSKMRRYGKNPDAIWLSHTNWHRLEQELGARAIRDAGTAATFGLPTLKYASPNGTLRVYAGAFCPDDVGYLLKRSTWCLYHLDPVPHFAEDDGLRMLRGATYDGVEVRVRFWCELGCTNMSENARFAIS